MAVNVITLSQDYPTAGALTITQVESPEDYTLYAFLYTDWQDGNQAVSYSKGQTGLNADGSWKNPILVLSDIYNLVVSNGITTCVVAFHLSV